MLSPGKFQVWVHETMSKNVVIII